MTGRTVSLRLGPMSLALFLLPLLLPSPLCATTQTSDQDGGSSAPRRSAGRAASSVLEAVRLEGAAPEIDGRLDEPAWATAPLAGDFVQFEPDEGAPPSQRTEARVLYAADALYVGIRAFDSAPDSIVGQLTRRDQPSFSDELGVVVDSYFDRRTAFHFSVNPVGVKHDVYRFEDTREDAGWDAVWDVATLVDQGGWSAEFRIPYSQLRFKEAREQTWGINFLRRIARHEETSVWAPTSRSESRIVSRLGELRGLRDLRPPRRVEVVPYTLGRLERAPGDGADPFYSRSALSSAAGADMKMGVGGSLTLDLTLNPDFGQVEADPAQVNLEAFETFLPERRPFFVEGSNLFGFSLALGDGDDAVESLFYSRRVGRAPQGSVGADRGWVDGDDNTTILGAWKLSGKTPGGWSVGIMNAVTSEENARIAPFDGGARTEASVEPSSFQGVARLSRDFRAGRSAVGFIGTGLERDGETADALLLRRGAWAGGVDFRHRFGEDRYQLGGYLLGSRVSGSDEAVLATQLSSARWFQRPDARHLELDPERTSLSGASAQLALNKISGGHWRWGTGFQTRSPGFEVNDLGYMRETDFTTGFVYLGYDQSAPQGPFRRWRLNLNGWNSFSYGRERYNTGGNVNGNFQLKSFWGGYGGVNYDAGGLSSGLLRGGPAFLREAQVNGWGGLSSDSRRSVQLRVNTNWNLRPESDSWRLHVGPDVSWRPSGRASVSMGTFFSRNVDDRQWVARVQAGAPHYLFGRLDQSTFGLTGRTDYAFAPTLSLQLYAQPFVSSGKYGDLKRVADPRAERYRDRFEAVTVGVEEEGRYRADLDGDGVAESFRRPDFDSRQFRSNAVLRWEYRPGSTVYVVWSQGRTYRGSEGTFDLTEDLRGLFGADPTNVLMVKASYWLNP